ncbi:MAG: DUF1585 domain-containing protein, partial [Polyangiaceae bacterium]
AREMAEKLQADERFSACLLEKLFVFALGRDVTEADEQHLEEITAGLAEANYGLPAAIKLIATSPPFRMRRGTKTDEVSSDEEVSP